jgi:ATP-dependent Clp protease adaptor protein ClpS
MTDKNTKTRKESRTVAEPDVDHQLVLINDEEHSFEYVIDTLIDVCQHTEEQAIQCTMITHYKGRCDVKRGPVKMLRPLRKALTEKELRAIIC